ncbi:MAG: hypothetical protein EBR82_31495 [Caulobacteraceae bacterium]|nr:hypothetical protein [Caulobacteraceae bacterium]
MSVKIEGIDSVRRVLSDLLPSEARLLTRQTTKDVAQAIVDQATPLMPVDQGDLVRSTKARQEKDKDGVGQASVRVEKRAFYWRFLEYGDGPDGIEYAFFARARELVMSNIDEVATRAFVRRLAARIQKVAGR